MWEKEDKKDFWIWRITFLFLHFTFCCEMKMKTNLIQTPRDVIRSWCPIKIASPPQWLAAMKSFSLGMSGFASTLSVCVWGVFSWEWLQTSWDNHTHTHIRIRTSDKVISSITRWLVKRMRQGTNLKYASMDEGIPKTYHQLESLKILANL